VPQVVQPDQRQLLLPQRLAGLGGQAGEAAGVPLGVAVRAIEVTEHQRRVAHGFQGQQSARRSVGTQRGDGARVEVDDPGPAGLGRPLDQLLARALGLHHADAATDREAAGVQVDVPPAQGQRLTSPHPGYWQKRRPRTRGTVVMRHESRSFGVSLVLASVSRARASRGH
jgi:hypothetical protein